MQRNTSIQNSVTKLNGFTCMHANKFTWIMNNNQHTCMYTVKPRLEAHLDIILFEVFVKSIDLIPQQILQRHYLYYR